MLELIKLYAYSISKDAYDHLRRLARRGRTNESSPVFIPQETNSGLCAELDHLRHMGYIAYHGERGIKGTSDLPKGDQTWGVLFGAIKVTEPGVEFLKFREEMEQQEAHQRLVPQGQTALEIREPERGASGSRIRRLIQGYHLLSNSHA